MARTHDPSAATKKAWLSRARASDGGGVVQQRGDFATNSSLPKADLRPLLKEGWSAYFAMKARNAGVNLTDATGKYVDPKTIAEVSRATAKVSAALGKLDLPSPVADYLPAGIRIGPDALMDLTVGGLLVPVGVYNRGGVMLNATKINMPSSVPENTIGHEMGHHAHLTKLTDGAAQEWSRISDKGRNCKVSDYGREDSAEHFAEAFGRFACGDPHRSTLKKLEPESYAFMERLWRDRSMWLPDGEQSSFDAARARVESRW